MRNYILLFMFIISHTVFAGTEHFKLLQGNAVQSVVPFIAEQRVTLFAGYPYLYQASVEDDLPYVRWFAKLPQSAVVVAYHDEQPVGFIAGTPFKDFDEHFQGSVALFKSASLNSDEYYYVSEVIVLPDHRGKKLSQKLFAMLEEHVKNLGYAKICFVTESHADHPLKPTGYKELDGLWKKLGYTSMRLSIQFSWPTQQMSGERMNQEHILDYWEKKLD